MTVAADHPLVEEVVAPALRRSFELFWKHERQELYAALIVALGDADLAGEALNEAFARAWERWKKISGYDNPAGWVYRVGVNWGRSFLRKARRRPPPGWSRTVEDPPQLPDEELAAAVKELSRLNRDVVVLRFVLDWSIRQIAEALSIPEGTVKSRIHRSLAQLRTRLEASA